MGISRDSWHKRKSTGGRVAQQHGKRKFEMGRPPANTRLGKKRIRTVRTRGGNQKVRALRLETGNFAWGSESVTRVCRISEVVYNASNNELVRTNTLVKGAVVVIDAAPFRQWYAQRYGSSSVGTSKNDEKPSASRTKKIANHSKDHKLDPKLEEQLSNGRLYAAIASRPGQVGKADGYILEGKELDFVAKKLAAKTTKKK
jgi:small subunit ribosomal protein S8e